MDHASARAIINAAFPRPMGRAATLPEAQFGQAIALGETSYGRGWGLYPSCANSFNWGAVQSTGAGCGATDSRPDGTRYDQNFMVYPDDLAGAADMLRHLYKLSPAVLASVDAGDGSDAAVAHMFRAHYFGSWCPRALAKYGDAAKASEAFTGKPATTMEGKACEAECIQNYADAVAKNIATIAHALGEPPMPRVGAISTTSLLAVLGVAAAGGAGLIYLRRKGRR